MRYFSYIAEQSFRTGPQGERLFYALGPWSRPYLIPDAATAQRMLRKLVWTLRFTLGGLIVGQPLVFTAFPGLITNPAYCVAYLLAVTAAYLITIKIALASDLRGLSRAETHTPLRSFYRDMARRHSAPALALGLAASVIFVALGGFIMTIGVGGWPAAITCTAFFALCAAAWGYALWLKLSPARQATAATANSDQMESS